MTWNVWWRFGPRWTERQPGLLATIRRWDPDVLALQEVWGDHGTSQAEQLADALGGHALRRTVLSGGASAGAYS